MFRESEVPAEQQVAMARHAAASESKGTNQLFNPLKFPAKTFTRHLASRHIEGYSNPWTGDSDAAELRRSYLETHLSTRHPVYLLLSEYSVQTDAGETGIPLVSEFAATMGIVPKIGTANRLTNRPRPTHDPLTSELWRSLNMSQVADRVLCFSIIPFIPLGHRPTDPEYNQHFRWARAIMDWYPDLKVVAVGSKADRILCLNGVDHQTIKPPNRLARKSVIDQVFDLVIP